MERSPSQDFAAELSRHLNGAYRLARRLTRNAHDADDVVQEAYLRAFRSVGHFRGGDARPWLLRIVRNVFYTSIKRNSTLEPMGGLQDSRSPDTLFLGSEQALVRRLIVENALKRLPTYCREVLVLREVEELSYKEISELLGVPSGTVMSRLSRARARLRQSAGSG